MARIPSLSRHLKPLFVAATFATCLGSGVLMLLGPERVMVLADMQYVPWFAYLGAALVAVALSYTMGWGWRAMAVASVALVLAVVMDFNFGAPERGTGAVRVMTFNVKDYETLKHPRGGAEVLAREVMRYNPDIAVFQDATDFYDEIQPQKLFPGWHVFGSDELTIASRFRLDDCRDEIEKLASKNLHHIACVVQGRDWKLDVHAVHFVSPRLGLTAWRYGPIRGVHEWDNNVEGRMGQAVALARYISRMPPRQAIIAGDLNAPPRSMVLRVLEEAGFRDAFATAGVGYGFTYGHIFPPFLDFLRLDHVLVDASIGVADCFVAPAGVSPHRAVVADLVLKPER